MLSYPKTSIIERIIHVESYQEVLITMTTVAVYTLALVASHSIIRLSRPIQLSHDYTNICLPIHTTLQSKEFYKYRIGFSLSHGDPDRDMIIELNLPCPLSRYLSILPIAHKFRSRSYLDGSFEFTVYNKTREPVSVLANQAFIRVRFRIIS